MAYQRSAGRKFGLLLIFYRNMSARRHYCDNIASAGMVWRVSQHQRWQQRVALPLSDGESGDISVAMAAAAKKKQYLNGKLWHGGESISGIRHGVMAYQRRSEET